VIASGAAARFPLVDSMRAIAALAILAYHGALVTGALDGTGSAFWYAQLNAGVPLFFAISGFLLYRPWVAARLSGARPPHSRVYALRRVLRIVPAYWVALSVIALAVERDDVFSWPGALVHYGFLQAYDPERFTGGIGQAWTLTVELAFYAALPLIALGARRLPGGSAARIVRGELGLLAALALVAVGWRLAVVASVDPAGDAYFPLLVALPAQLDVFAGGMALAVVSAAGLDGRARPPCVAVLAWALAAAAYAAVVLWRPDDPGARVFVEHQLQGLLAIALLAPAVLGAAGGGAVRRLLAWRPLAWVGLVSYGLYLWHLDVLRELGERDVPAAWIVVLGSSLALALGAASWYLVERHALRMGRRAAGRPPTGPTAGRPQPTTAETVGR
jgi:peptidoglycan/LPS O-acetylase OafA/YrhL